MREPENKIGTDALSVGNLYMNKLSFCHSGFLLSAFVYICCPTV